MEEDHLVTIRTILKGNMDTSREVFSFIERFDLNSEGVEHDSLRVLLGMKDELQVWNAIVILAHVKVLSGEPTFGKELEHELVGAITSLRKENISEGMMRQLEIIAEFSGNDLARAAARRKLE
jgi:hypothetical protein